MERLQLLREEQSLEVHGLVIAEGAGATAALEEICTAECIHELQDPLSDEVEMRKKAEREKAYSKSFAYLDIAPQ